MASGVVCVTGTGALGVELLPVRTWALSALRKSPLQATTPTLALRILPSGWKVFDVPRVTAEFATVLMSHLDTSHVATMMT